MLAGRSCVCAAVLAAAFGAAGSTRPEALAAGEDPAGGQGHVERKAFKTASTDEYLAYLPQGWSASKPLPMYVMVHGCGTTAGQQMGANQLNPIADRERFIVVYPDNGGQCWPAIFEDATVPITGSSNITRGGGGAADAIAGITREASAAYGADPERVYIMGMSSGAFQTSATAGAYPDLFAAAGNSAGPGYGMPGTCLVTPTSLLGKYAERTVAQMGPRARVMPFFAIGGTADPLGEQTNGPVGGCARLAYYQWLLTNNFIARGSTALTAADLDPENDALHTGDAFRHDPTSTEQGQVPNGWAWTRTLARDRAGCQIAQRWIVTGMGHAWSGGSPAGSEFNDPKGPDASQASWDFFKQFTLSGGNRACGQQTSGSSGSAPAGGLGTSGKPGATRRKASRTRVSVQSIRVGSKRTLRMRITCPRKAASRCKGTVTLRRSHKALTSLRFNLKPGNRRQVRLRIPKKTYRALKRRGHLKAEIAVRGTSLVSARRTVTLRLPR